MRDLFGSTSFIKFGVVETILSSSDAVNKLLLSEENNNLEEGYTLDDYLSNIDSYLYGIVLFPGEENNYVRTWIKNYIMYLYIPLIEKDPIYIVKSRFVGEIFRINDKESRLNNNIKEFLLNDIFNYLSNVVLFNEEKLQEKLNNLDIDKSLFLEFLIIYYYIYRNKEYIKSIYINNENMRSELISHFDFLK